MKRLDLAVLIPFVVVSFIGCVTSPAGGSAPESKATLEVSVLSHQETEPSAPDAGIADAVVEPTIRPETTTETFADATTSINGNTTVATPTLTPTPHSPVALPPTSTKTPPTATPVPATPTPAVSDREALLTYINKIWPSYLRWSEASAQYVARAKQGKTKNDQVGAIDQFVKDLEPLIPAVKAVTPPDVPFAKSFHVKFVESLEKEYDAMKRINWGLVTDNADIFYQAQKDLNDWTGIANQTVWELKAAYEKQGLRYDSQAKKWY